MSKYSFSHVVCPSSMWQEEEWDDTVCYVCQSKLGDGPADNSFEADVLFDEGFCSPDCRAAFLTDWKKKVLATNTMEGAMRMGIRLRQTLCMRSDYSVVLGALFVRETFPPFKKCLDLGDKIMEAVWSKTDERLLKQWRLAFKERCLESAVRDAIGSIDVNYFKAGLDGVPGDGYRKMLRAHLNKSKEESCE